MERPTPEEIDGASVLNNAVALAQDAARRADALDGPIAACRAGAPLAPGMAADLMESLQVHLRKSGEQHVLIGVLAMRCHVPPPHRSFWAWLTGR